jgi:hypothetical protein
VPLNFRVSLLDCIFHTLARLGSSIRVGCDGRYNDS